MCWMDLSGGVGGIPSWPEPWGLGWSRADRTLGVHERALVGHSSGEIRHHVATGSVLNATRLCWQNAHPSQVHQVPGGNGKSGV